MCEGIEVRYGVALDEAVNYWLLFFSCWCGATLCHCYGEGR